MTRTIVLLLFFFSSLSIHAQNDFFSLKKGRLTIESFQQGSHITFQLTNRQWFTGYILNIRNDSFLLMQEIVRYTMMGADSVHIRGPQVAISDVYALPRKGNMVVYHDDRVSIMPGKESVLYIKNGLLFQLGGGGYIALNLLNNLFSGDPPFAGKNKYRLAAGAVVFLFGEILHWGFKPVIRIGKKYHIQSVHL